MVFVRCTELARAKCSHNLRELCAFARDTSFAAPPCEARQSRTKAEQPLPALPRVLFIVLENASSGFTKLRPSYFEALVTSRGAAGGFVPRRALPIPEFFSKVTCFVCEISRATKIRNYKSRRSCRVTV